MSEFQTVKNNLHKTRMVTTGDAVSDFTLEAGEALLQLERFSFTANNVTYGASGDMIGYWQFFPPSQQEGQHEGDTYGLIPVWGMAEVVASQCDGVATGERVYGYFPPAHFLKVTPGRINPYQFTDMAAHRAALPPIYNNYTRLDNEPGYQRELDNHRALLQPLHATSYLLCDKLGMENNYGAEQIIIVSASSKTAIGLAYGLAHGLSDASAQSADRPHIIGVTSPGNAGFVESLGHYDQVITYDDLAAIETRASTIVDMSGNSGYLGRLHAHLGAAMVQCVNVGLTHWEQLGDADADAAKIITEPSGFFFAPSHAAHRSTEWGAEEFNKRMQAFLAGSIAASQGWMQVVEAHGLDALAARYGAMVEGQFNPTEGLIITL